jgi:uncharacterized protein
MSLQSAQKPRPEPDTESAPFWNGVRQHKLLVQECARCGTRRFPATTYCAHCQSGESRWIECTGRGEVFSWVVVRHPVPKETYANEVPYVVALITLDEGPRLVSNIVGCDPHAVEAGMRVKVRFEDQSDGTVLPKFEPAAAAVG